MGPVARAEADTVTVFVGDAEALSVVAPPQAATETAPQAARETRASTGESTVVGSPILLI
jgi:hypothetical protein